MRIQSRNKRKLRFITTNEKFFVKSENAALTFSSQREFLLLLLTQMDVKMLVFLSQVQISKL